MEVEEVRIRDILLKGEVSRDDYAKLFPNQSKSSASANFRKTMNVLKDIGLAEKNGNGTWKVRADVIRSIEEFERIRKKIGYEGDLFEFLKELFRKTLEIWKNGGGFLSALAQEHGVDESALKRFIENFLDSFEWKTEEDLEGFVNEFRKGLWVRINPELYSEIKNENRKEIEKLKYSGVTEEIAVMIVINKLLFLSVPSLGLWEDIREDAGEQGTYVWLINRLAERRGMEGTELVPVSKKLWDRLQNEIAGLRDSQRSVLKTKLVKRLNDAVEKTIKDARSMKRKK